MRVLLVNPAGLVALLGLAVPIAVHLLLRRRAPSAPFPSLRFIPRSSAAAVRVRRVSDWWLLVVRCALVAIAAGALAQPLLVTPAHERLWNARVARAIVVDTSPSTGVTPAAAPGIALEAGRTAFRSHVIPSRDLEAGIREAVDWLEEAPPARRELVVISDFQHGALNPIALTRVPAPIGIHLRQRQATGAGTSVAMQAIHIEIRTPEPEQRFARAALEAAGQTLQPTLRIGSSREVRTVVIFTRGAEPDVVPGLLRAAWMAPVASALAEDPELNGELRRAGIGPLATGAWDDTRMTATLNAPASAFLLPLTIRAIRRATYAPTAWREHEQATLGAEQLTALSRPPHAVSAANLRLGRQAGSAVEADEHDARWLWLAALVLIAAETILRRRLDRSRGGARSEEDVRAA